MIEAAPLRHFRDIRITVVLVHGVEDLRVGFELTRRMQRKLDPNGNPPIPPLGFAGSPPTYKGGWRVLVGWW